MVLSKILIEGELSWRDINYLPSSSDTSFVISIIAGACDPIYQHMVYAPSIKSHPYSIGFQSGSSDLKILDLLLKLNTME